MSSGPVLHFYQVLIDCVGFNDTSILVGHFVSSPREREKIVEEMKARNREERGKGMKVKKQNNILLVPLPATGMPCPTVSQYQLDAPGTQNT